MKPWAKAAAVKEALNGEHSMHRHGCVIESGGKILATGFNSYKVKHPHLSIYSTHAEMSALAKLYPQKLKGTNLYVARISTNGTIKNSKPCPVCMRHLEVSGIKRVFYSIDGINNWGCIDL